MEGGRGMEGRGLSPMWNAGEHLSPQQRQWGSLGPHGVHSGPSPVQDVDELPPSDGRAGVVSILDVRIASPSKSSGCEEFPYRHLVHRFLSVSLHSTHSGEQTIWLSLKVSCGPRSFHNSQQPLVGCVPFKTRLCISSVDLFSDYRMCLYVLPMSFLKGTAWAGCVCVCTHMCVYFVLILGSGKKAIY